jgi:hypothetical protein
VPWCDVVRIEIRPLRQRMDLVSAAGRRFLSLRPELEAFAAVQDYIIAHMQPRGCTPPCSIPLLSTFAGGPLAIMSALLAVWFGPRRGPLPAGLFAGLSLLLALLWLARRSRIDLTSDRLVLRQGWRGLVVPFRDITAVRVQARPLPQGGALHFIVLEREGSDSIPIAGFRHGYNEAYQCIEPAWRAARAAAALRETEGSGTHSTPARG